ncbi:hypothetical protein [Nesterenkonia flava]|uniref:Flp pilus-assembly TadG-like N-terminal domain-containing protein n=1 Tax=Nesterenkonia flava TaxID=469799 RepID=A0ABU1FSJ3_9MICC|nr:hypothetical protein [Nesterenkonia flava]MDR5711642.1 hypothetical protein [Nesterenkonia flava]
MSRTPEHARRLFAQDTGQTTVLTLGVLTLALMLIAVIGGATAVNLEARKLLAAADGAASAAVVEAQISGAGNRHPVPRLQEAQIRAAAEQYLLQTGADRRFDELRVSRAWTSDGAQTAHLELTAEVPLPVIRWVLPASVRVSAESHARVSLNR